MSLRYRVVSIHEIDTTLVEAWRQIQATNPRYASPYFCPAFTQRVGEVRNDARLVVIEHNNRIAGFFPFQRSLLGMGKPIGGPFSDYHGVVALPDTPWDTASLLRAANLSVWSFNHLVDDSQKFDTCIETRTTSPQIGLEDGYKNYVAGRRAAGSDYIPKTEGLARKLGREFGALQFTLHEPGPEALAQLIRWKGEQYRESKLMNLFETPWTGKLLERIAATQTADFAGVCSVLRAGERVVAIHMGMRSANVMHYWFPAYDPEFAKFSTGIILLLRMAEALAESGVHTIDLGEGKSAYKERLMTREAPLLRGAVELPSLLTSARRLQRTAERYVAQGSVPRFFSLPLSLPLRAIRRIERTTKFR